MKRWWVYILIFIISQLSSFGVAMGMAFVNRFVAVGSGWTLVLALFVANVMAILLFMVNRPEAVTWGSTMAGFRGQRGRRTGLMLMAAVPLIGLVNIVQEAFFPEIPDIVGDDAFKMIISNPLGLLTVALIGPVGEELLFRGGVQTDFYPKEKAESAAASGEMRGGSEGAVTADEPPYAQPTAGNVAAGREESDERSDEDSAAASGEMRGGSEGAVTADEPPYAQPTAGSAAAGREESDEENAAAGSDEESGERSAAGRGWEMWRPVVLSAVIFSLVHMNPAQMPVAFILGLLLGFAYWWTGSLAASMSIHVFNNSFACLLWLVAPEGDSLIDAVGGKENAGMLALVCVFVLLISVHLVNKEGLLKVEKS